MLSTIVNADRPYQETILQQVCDERDYPICEIIGGERLSIVGQLCLNNGTACFQNRELLGQYDDYSEKSNSMSYSCQQSYSRISVWSGKHVQELDIPRGCVCQEETTISIVASIPDECMHIN